MFYLVNGLLLTIASMGFNSKRAENIIYRMLWIYLTVILCIRYGQGTDYFGYYMNYTRGDAHSEFLWKISTEFLFKQGIVFELFVAIIGFFSMVLIDRFIYKYSDNKCLSLLVLYPTIYFVYFFSGIRMGFVIATFLGGLVPLLYEKKYLYYYLLCACLMLVHSASIIFILVPFFIKISRNMQILIMGVSLCLGIVLCYIPAQLFRPFNIGALQYYIDDRGIGILSLLEKIFVLALILLFYKKNDVLTGIFFYAISISFITVSWQFISSRFYLLCGCTYVVLLANIPRQVNLQKNRNVLWCLIIMYCFIILCKNINAYLIQTSLNGITIFTCPYITIFNKETYEPILEMMDLYRKLLRT